MFVINKKELAANRLRKDALEIIDSAYQAIDVELLTKKRIKLDKNLLSISGQSLIKKINLDKFKRIFIVGFGKKSHSFVATLIKILNPVNSKLAGAIALDVKHHKHENKNSGSKDFISKTKFLVGTHPKPSLLNIKATKKILELLENAKEDDLIIYFIGGGGSSLLCGSLGELKSASFIFDRLTKAGAPIDDINIVRKHISEVKGGGLAKFSYPAHSISLIVSDVCGDDVSTIASGPTFFDKTEISDAIEVFKKYKIPFKGIIFVETPKEKKYFKNCEYFILASNRDAALAMKSKANQLGYDTVISDLALEKNADNVFYFPLKQIRNKQAVVMAGESRVVIKGKGRGGRNQEACLSVLAKSFENKLDINDCLVSSFASDGYDNTPCAGALVDEHSLLKTKQLNLNPKKYLAKNDSYAFFKKEGDLIIADKKSFNVSDLMVIIKK